MPTENRANKTYLPTCLCNPGVCCDTPFPATCASCGWNPAVAQKRLLNMQLRKQCADYGSKLEERVSKAGTFAEALYSIKSEDEQTREESLLRLANKFFEEEL